MYGKICKNPRFTQNFSWKYLSEGLFRQFSQITEDPNPHLHLSSFQCVLKVSDHSGAWLNPIEPVARQHSSVGNLKTDVPSSASSFLMVLLTLRVPTHFHGRTSTGHPQVWVPTQLFVLNPNVCATYLLTCHVDRLNAKCPESKAHTPPSLLIHLYFLFQENHSWFLLLLWLSPPTCKTYTCLLTGSQPLSWGLSSLIYLQAVFFPPFIYLFICLHWVKTQLQHMGSFLVAHGLSAYDTQTLQSWSRLHSREADSRVHRLSSCNVQA